MVPGEIPSALEELPGNGFAEQQKYWQLTASIDTAWRWSSARPQFKKRAMNLDSEVKLKPTLHWPIEIVACHPC